ncbi:hypothetical protein C8R45DRAFT_1115154 [Mycena sanguinolenta]|nr:hypothetical protein C8R45DRAFT_1115154 [Mycena sanguinolenta]
MATSNPAAHTSQNIKPFIVRRRRTTMACVNSRMRKMRCITTEQPPKNPCDRCGKKGQYVSIDTHHDDVPMDFGLLAPPITSTDRGRPWMQPSSWVPARLPLHDFSQGPGPAFQLPYTMPPPPNSRPRYAGTSYPDLSLSTSSPPNVSNRYTAILNPGYNHQLAQPYQSTIPAHEANTWMHLRQEIPQRMNKCHTM